MKNKLIKTILFLLVLVTFTDSSNADGLCCSTGCYPEANQCCPAGDKINEKGYVGCYEKIKDTNGVLEKGDYTCPENSLGDCVFCACEDEKTCYWMTKRLGDTCNSCKVTIATDSDREIEKSFDSDDMILIEEEIGGYVINSECQEKCPKGETGCGDRKCEEECEEPENPPICIDDDFCDKAGGEGCECEDCQNEPTNACVEETYCCGDICSGDSDLDGTCDFYDYCINLPPLVGNTHTDADNDCFDINGDKTSLFGYCGDACDPPEDTCDDPHYPGTRMCCNILQQSGFEREEVTFIKPFKGGTIDCPFNPEFGCWGECYGVKNGQKISFEIGACIEGTRTITTITQNLETEEITETTEEEPCTSIPLLPFYTNINILATFSILIIYYLRKK